MTLLKMQSTMFCFCFFNNNNKTFSLKKIHNLFWTSLVKFCYLEKNESNLQILTSSLTFKDNLAAASRQTGRKKERKSKKRTNVVAAAPETVVKMLRFSFMISTDEEKKKDETKAKPSLLLTGSWLGLLQLRRSTLQLSDFSEKKREEV